jgi:cell division inhibitor SepF
MDTQFMDNLKVFFGFKEEEDGYEEPTTPVSATQTRERKPIQPIKAFKGSLVNTQNTKKLHTSEIKVEEPRIYEDSLMIASYLRENTPIIVNLKYLDTDSSKRLVDFICGTAYAINGHMMKIGENIFLFTPPNIHISEPTNKQSLHETPAETEKEVFFKKVAF